MGQPSGVHESGGTPYDPYGQAVSTTGTDVAFRYAGQYRTTSLALYKMGMRYYDMKIGRWTQPDPLDQTGDLTEGNRYGYVSGNPINSVDPTGTHTDLSPGYSPCWRTGYYPGCAYGDASRFDGRISTVALAGWRAAQTVCGLRTINRARLTVKQLRGAAVRASTPALAIGCGVVAAGTVGENVF